MHLLGTLNNLATVVVVSAVVRSSAIHVHDCFNPTLPEFSREFVKLPLKILGRKIPEPLDDIVDTAQLVTFLLAASPHSVDDASSYFCYESCRRLLNLQAQRLLDSLYLSSREELD